MHGTRRERVAVPRAIGADRDGSRLAIGGLDRECGAADRELSRAGHDYLETRHWLANEAFAFTARYDGAISRWFGLRYEHFPEHWVMGHEKFLDLSYGENPHQGAALYVEVGVRSHVLSRVAKRHGR